jgi:trk system potassium uptake protein TrkH
MTLICELIGAIITFFVIRYDYPVEKALFLSLFHAVSLFCNVGISLFQDNSLAYHTNTIMMLTSTVLILLGSLGFVTWHECAQLIQHWNCKEHHHKLSWHTRLVLTTFFIISLVTGILFWILERNTTLHNLTSLQTLLHVILVSISTKSSGYLPIAINLVQPATILLFALTAFIGTAPSSTGGGIKTSAFAIFLAVIRATLHGRYHAEINGRRIATDQVYKAMALIALACFWITTITFCLLITEQHQNFITILFEVISALSNNGMSLGLTASLSVLGKVLLMITMIFGRIGALIFIIGIRKLHDTAEYSYPEERVILG